MKEEGLSRFFFIFFREEIGEEWSEKGKRKKRGVEKRVVEGREITPWVSLSSGRVFGLVCLLQSNEQGDGRVPLD